MADSRHPRGYDGAQLTTRSLGWLLGKALQQLQYRRAQQPEELLAAWPKAIGQQLAPFAHAERYEEGVLYVRVANSTVYSVLATEKASLLQQFKRQLPSSGVRNIVFRLG